MGKLFSRFRKKKEVRILMVGLDGAGKTTILYKLKLGDTLPTVPTIGFNVESIKHKEKVLTFWDVGGQDKIRALWKHYYQSTTGVVFVVDSSDQSRVDDAKEELSNMLLEDDLANVVVLVFANKQDISGALSPQELSERLALSKIQGHNNHIIGCTAVSGDGLNEGLDWLVEAIKENKKRVTK